jgi:hypothetical protein
VKIERKEGTWIQVITGRRKILKKIEMKYTQPILMSVNRYVSPNNLEESFDSSSESNECKV